MNRSFDVRFVMTTAAVAALAGAIGIVILYFALKGDDDDRPPIIVRSGSALIDDGDSSNSKPWRAENAGDKKHWRPDQPHGWPVRLYSVTVAGANGSGDPSAPCPKVAMLATKIDFEYRYSRPGASGPQTDVATISVGIAQTGKSEPVLSSSVDLEPPASNPAELIYNPGGGGFSKVTLSGVPGGSTQSCFFDGQSKAVITLTPAK